jgi:hypothetical protein
MTNDNIVIEHLRHIRRKVDVMYDDLIDVRNRVSNLELGQANQQRSIDILSDRISRIEDRLELKCN